jgi:L-rhamnonate dehydratase
VSCREVRNPEHRGRRRPDRERPGSLVVEVEACDGTVGFAVGAGGEPACWIIENHLARFVEGRLVADVEAIWDEMRHAALFSGRKAMVLEAISCIDLALWDLLAKTREEPVHALLGGPVREELSFYLAGSRPDFASQQGFIGGKLQLPHGPIECEDGLKKNLEQLAEMRAKCGPDFCLMLDCATGLDVDYATRLARAAHDQSGLRWIEDALPCDDYGGYAQLRRNLPPGMQVSTGDHGATRWGFEMLLDLECCDILQPDLAACGGLTELIRISALAEPQGKLVIPRGSSVYSYHFAAARHHSPFAEFLNGCTGGDAIVPLFRHQLLDEPIPVNGRLKVSALDRPGFGVRLDPTCRLCRPFAH